MQHVLSSEMMLDGKKYQASSDNNDKADNTVEVSANDVQIDVKNRPELNSDVHLQMDTCSAADYIFDRSFGQVGCRTSKKYVVL